MLEATDFANRDHLAEFRPLNWEESKEVEQESDH